MSTLNNCSNSNNTITILTQQVKHLTTCVSLLIKDVNSLKTQLNCTPQNLQNSCNNESYFTQIHQSLKYVLKNFGYNKELCSPSDECVGKNDIIFMCCPPIEGMPILKLKYLGTTCYPYIIVCDNYTTNINENLKNTIQGLGYVYGLHNSHFVGYGFLHLNSASSPCVTTCVTTCNTQNDQILNYKFRNDTMNYNYNGSGSLAPPLTITSSPNNLYKFPNGTTTCVVTNSEQIENLCGTDNIIFNNFVPYVKLSKSLFDNNNAEIPYQAHFVVKINKADLASLMDGSFSYNNSYYDLENMTIPVNLYYIYYTLGCTKSTKKITLNLKINEFALSDYSTYEDYLNNATVNPATDIEEWNNSTVEQSLTDNSELTLNMQCISTGNLNNLTFLTFEIKLPITPMVNTNEEPLNLTLHNGKFVDKSMDRYFAIEADNKFYVESNIIFC